MIPQSSGDASVMDLDQGAKQDIDLLRHDGDAVSSTTTEPTKSAGTASNVVDDVQEVPTSTQTDDGMTMEDADGKTMKPEAAAEENQDEIGSENTLKQRKKLTKNSNSRPAESDESHGAEGDKKNGLSMQVDKEKELVKQDESEEDMTEILEVKPRNSFRQVFAFVALLCSFIVFNQLFAKFIIYLFNLDGGGGVGSTSDSLPHDSSEQDKEIQEPQFVEQMMEH